MIATALCAEVLPSIEQASVREATMRQYEQAVIDFSFPSSGQSPQPTGNGMTWESGKGRPASCSTKDTESELSAVSATDVVHFRAYAHLVSIDPQRNRHRFYTLTWQPSLFGGGAIVKRWGRVGTDGQWQAAFFGTRDEAQTTVEEILKRRLGHGYQIIRWD